MVDFLYGGSQIIISKYNCISFSDRFSSPLGSWVSLWNFGTITGSLLKPKWQKLASLAQQICTLQFQFFGAVFASKGYPFKNIFLSACSVDPDEMTLYVAFQGLLCLPK